MAKTKYCLIIWPFPLYFCPIFVRKWPIQRQHFPVVLRAHLYIFGISGGRRTGITCMLIQNSTFYFFAPPNMYLLLHWPCHCNPSSASCPSHIPLRYPSPNLNKYYYVFVCGRTCLIYVSAAVMAM